MSSLLEGAKLKVSSVLNKDSKSFGRQFLTDGDEETCWNSEQGTPQWISIEFPEAVIPLELQIMFQGGFVGQDCQILGSTDGNEWGVLNEFYPEDINSRQTFRVFRDEKERKEVKGLKIMFGGSTDTYGRVVVYDLRVVR
ncbi:Nuclear receptor 2C2-associated protein [Chytridiales sp. JEL 0842]|nr:Nuclear receptor 2C2-associated protein [Chytridiales sp. JEL 0842]